MRRLHRAFAIYIREGLYGLERSDKTIRKNGEEGRGRASYSLTALPSSTAFVKKSNPLKNAEKHVNGKFFYITDLCHAYQSVDLERLAAVLVYIKKHEVYKPDFDISICALGSGHDKMKELHGDPLHYPMLSFLRIYCGGIQGVGLAVGAPLSPYLFNLYCEVFLDLHMRKLCEQERICYTRYADDLVFSSDRIIAYPTREKIRSLIFRAKFDVNHRKSKLRSRDMGTVFVTKIGLRNPGENSNNSQVAVLVFPQKKRRKLHGLIGSYLRKQMDHPSLVSGYIAEFLYYYKNVAVKTETDKKTFALCKAFKAEREKYEKPRKANR